MTQTTRDTGLGKPPRRLPRPRPLTTLLGVAGLTLITAGFFLQGSTPAVDPTAPRGYGSVTSPAPEPAPAPSTGNSSADNPDGGLLPDASATPVPPPEDDRAPASLVPVVSGRLEDLQGSDSAEPTRLVIPSLGIDAPIQPVGVADGEMQVPPRADLVAWYRFGPTPGEQGSAVLAAHVSWGGEPGVFYDLRDLPQGAEIEVRFADGSVRRFHSVALAAYDKSDLPVEQIFERDGGPVLTLITCGGAFNPSVRRFEQNVVAYAVPIDESVGSEPGDERPS